MRSDPIMFGKIWQVANFDSATKERLESFDGCKLTISTESAESLGFPGYLLISANIQAPAPGRIPCSWITIGEIQLADGTIAALANGYQCWSYSPILGPNDVLAPENNPNQETFGDFDLFQYQSEKGVFHSWSFSYTQLKQELGNTLSNNPFFAALDEDLGMTVFKFDLRRKVVTICYHIAGLNFSNDAVSAKTSIGSWIVPTAKTASHLALSEAGSRWMEALRRFERVNRRPRSDMQCEKLLGYTSWYYRYSNIDEAWIHKNLFNYKQLESWRVFQIDDGYQNKIGDWLVPADSFPGGVGKVIRAAVDAGKTPGIWWAPFVVIWNSEIAIQNPSWLIRDDQGQQVLCGDFPHWGGKFYALDLENMEVQDYLQRCVTEFAQMGVKFIKADFLYAAARAAIGGMTRAMRAARAHQFLYDLCHQQGIRLLSCGATLGAAFGRCDYSRIGPDVLPDWENKEILQFSSREKVSTRGSIVNAVTRSFLNGIAFGNDPDVIILRDKSNQLSVEQRRLLFEVNSAFGNLVFSSDEPGELTDAQLDLMKNAKPGNCGKVCKIATSAAGLTYHIESGSEAIEVHMDSGFALSRKFLSN